MSPHKALPVEASSLGDLEPEIRLRDTPFVDFRSRPPRANAKVRKQAHEALDHFLKHLENGKAIEFRCKDVVYWTQKQFVIDSYRKGPAVNDP